MRITNGQKKELSNIFKKYSLNLLDFEVTGQYKEFKIKFKHDYFYFAINKIKEDEYTVGICSIRNVSPNTFNTTWENLTKHFEGWIANLAKELKTETGWESFESSNFLNATFNDLNDTFSNEEKEQIKQSLLEFQSKIITLNLAAENLKTINLKIDSLLLKIDELNKFDWKSLFIGTIANLIMTMVIPPDLTGIVWEHIKSSFNGLKITG